MSAIGWQLPEHPLRASAITTKFVGLLAVVSLATLLRATLPLGGLYPVKASATFVVVMLLAIGFLHRHPFARFGPANQMTTARAILVALIASLIGEPASAAAASGAVAASLLVTLLDGIDGWLARRSRMASDFGARFDMETDALLILVLSTLAWRYDKAGAWVLLSGLLRYLFVGAGWIAEWLERPLQPSRRRQTICVVQIVGLILVVSPIVTRPLSTAVAAVALSALCYSFLVDALWLRRRASF